MFSLRLGAHGKLDLDKVEVETDCPRCGFHNPVFLKQARLRDVVICRGCKSNIRLDDYMNTVRKGRQSLQRALAEFVEAIRRLDRR